MTQRINIFIVSRLVTTRDRIRWCGVSYRSSAVLLGRLRVMILSNVLTVQFEDLQSSLFPDFRMFFVSLSYNTQCINTHTQSITQRRRVKTFEANYQTNVQKHYDDTEQHRESIGNDSSIK